MNPERHVTIDRHRARYFVHGAGATPVVLVASMYLMARTYTPTVRALVAREPRARVISIELPGSGGSSKLAVPWSYDDYAYCLLETLEALGIDRPAAIIGHSNSGAVVLTAAARHPSRVGPIVLADSTGGDAHARMRQMIPGRLFDFIYETPFSIRSAPDAVFNAWHHARSVMNQFALAQQDLSLLARRVAQPALLAWGAEDHTTPLRCAHSLAREMPNARTYISKDGSHDWIVDRADEFAGAAIKFVNATASG